MMRPGRPRAALFACVAALVGCDHASKLAAQAVLRARAPVVVVPGWMDLAYTENRDVAFSALSRLSLHPPAWALTALTLVTAAIVVFAWARRRRSGWREHVGFVLVSAGAIGNALGRLLSGRVIDFIHVHFWPVFNVADVMIVAGIALLLRGRRRAAGARDRETRILG